ncbi:MAG: hypothetical protein IJO56_03115 [Oscillospiraceae bacterium]|nr:hypothetical protein [Oscillospiraceae bacterium]
MRNFEERKAEVFRRSEKRIKERKARRNHILMACIPLVLCITLLGAFLFPGATPEDPNFNGPAGGGLTEDRFESLSCPIAKITVTGGDFSRTYKDVEDLLLISDQLYSYGSRGDETNGTSNNGIAAEGEDRKENADDIYGNITDHSNVAYTITLVTHEGVKTEYRLVGKTLKNLTTKQTYNLSQTQVNELYELLGIPQS